MCLAPLLGCPKGLCQLFSRKKVTLHGSGKLVVCPSCLAKAESGLERPWFVGGEPLAKHSTWFWTRVPVGWPSALSFPT